MFVKKLVAFFFQCIDNDTNVCKMIKLNVPEKNLYKIVNIWNIQN